MISRAVRLHGKNSISLDEITLPAVKTDELLVKIISDSICMSTYKAMVEGENHKRVPNTIRQQPVILGHEFCGEIISVGEKWKSQFSPGEKFSVQPIINYQGAPEAPGYSYPFIGGCATYGIIPNEVMEQNCLLSHNAPAFYIGSLAEPYCCVLGAFHSNYHQQEDSHKHISGIKPGGNMLFMAGTGPMGNAALDCALNMEPGPKTLVVSSRNKEKLKRMEMFFSSRVPGKCRLKFIHTPEGENSVGVLSASIEANGFDDIFIFAPSQSLVEQGDRLLAKDGCLNFFAGPRDPDFSARLNLFNVHYNGSHFVGSSGGTADDMKLALKMLVAGKLKPEILVTHIGGLDSVESSLKNLPNIPGGKKLIYTQISLPLTPLDALEQHQNKFPFFKELSRMVQRNHGLWSGEAESYLLAQASPI